MLDLLRLSTNKAVMGGTPYTTFEAWQAYQAMIELPEVSFVAEPLGIEIAMKKLPQTPKPCTADWTGAYQAALAILADLRMVSFDNGFKQYSGLALLALA